MNIPAWLRSFTVLMAWIFGVIICWEITKAFANLLNGPKTEVVYTDLSPRRPEKVVAS